jgi:hypothetical protein
LRLAIATTVLLCGITDKCGGLFGPSVGEKLDIASAPEGATVKLDGEEMGTTPLTLTELDVEEGQTQVLVFELEGYLPMEEKVTWTQAEQSVAVTLEEAAKERVITVKSIPSNSKVYIDGNNKGETPCSFSMEMLDGAEFNLLVQRKGYPDISEKVKVGPDTIITLSYNFKRDGGKAIEDLDEELVKREKKWRKACKTYASDLCSFEYSINPSGEVTNVDAVKCKYKDITGCTKRQVLKMEFPSTGKLRSDAYTWKGSN